MTSAPARNDPDATRHEETPRPPAPASTGNDTNRTPPGRGEGHIGRIAVGTLAAGFATAVALVVGPFAGAKEHVVTGAVLVTFALSWAALAALAGRRTNQPQRWARVPAAVMGAAGLVVLIAAPTGNELGWIWPPAIAALGIWMTTSARRNLRSRSGKVALYPVCAALVLSAIGGLYETINERTNHTVVAAMPGRLIDIGDHKLHLDCTGTGSPTVILEPGLGEPSTAMAWTAHDLATTTRVCTYDRAGRGWSTSAPAPEDGLQTATDLHTLLDRASETGPYVLAGHSAGGIYMLNFAHLYPDQVAGVVLLDSMHPQQYTRIPSWPGFYEMFRRASAVLPSLSRLGISRIIADNAYAGLPQPARNQERAFLSTPRHNRSVRDEFAELRTAMNQAQALTSLGDRPLVVLTAQKDAADGWMAAQDDLATLSTNVDHRLLPDATHASLTEDEITAGQATYAIVDVVSAARSGTSLSKQP